MTTNTEASRMLPARPAGPAPIDRSACPAARHGTRSARYVAGCVCHDGYLDAKRSRIRKTTRRLLTDRFVPGIGTARRLQGLAAAGYGTNYLGARLGVDHSLAGKWRTGRPAVTAGTHQAVLRLTHELHAAGPAPRNSNGAARARAHAGRRGWAGLDEWIDIDDPAELPERYYRLAPAAAAPEKTPITVLQEMRDIGVVPAVMEERTGLDLETIENRLHDAAAGYRQARRRRTWLTEEQVHEIRDEYLRTRTTTWSGKAVAARYGRSESAISAVIRGRCRRELGLTDLTAAAPCTVPRPVTDRPPTQLSEDTIRAVRADYLDGYGERRLAARHGISRSLADRIARGRIRPELKLTDLIAQKRDAREEHAA